jgi:hypothetical protein
MCILRLPSIVMTKLKNKRLQIQSRVVFIMNEYFNNYNPWWTREDIAFCPSCPSQSPCLIKDYRNAELTSSPCVYVDSPRNNMDMTDRTRCLHESITDCNYWNVHSRVAIILYRTWTLRFPFELHGTCTISAYHH